MNKLFEVLRSKLNNGFGKDVFITTCGQLVIVIITFLNNKIISSRFGPTVFAEYSLIQKTASVIAYVMVMSMGIVLPKYLAIYRVNKNEIKEKQSYIAAFFLVIITSFIIMIICVFFQEDFSALVFGDDSHAKNVFPTLILAVELAITALLYAYYRGVDNFLSYSISQVCIACLGLIIVAISSDMLRMVWMRAVIIGSVALFFLIRIIIKYLREKNVLVGIGSEIKTLLKVGLPRVPGEVVLFSFTTVPLILINGKIGLEEAAAYSVAFGINSAASPLFRYVGLALLPYTSKEVSKGNLNGVNRKLKYLGIIYAIISLCVIVAVMLVPDLFIIILYSQEYIIYRKTVQIIVLALLPNAIYLLLRNPIDAASDRPINTVNLAVSFVVMCVLIVNSNTNIGYAWSIFVGYLVLGILSVISWKVLSKRERNKNMRIV